MGQRARQTITAAEKSTETYARIDVARRQNLAKYDAEQYRFTPDSSLRRVKQDQGCGRRGKPQAALPHLASRSYLEHLPE